MNRTPPRFFLRFFRWYCHPSLRNSIEGDLTELYNERIKIEGNRKADLKFMIDVLLLFRRGIIRNVNISLRTNNYMVKNYLKIGFRNLAKSKFFSSINISGMAISMASFLIITLFVYDEFQFDKHIEGASTKYRIFNENFSEDGTVRRGAMIPPMIAPTLAAEYPEVDYYARFINFNLPILFKVRNKKFTEDKGGGADPRIFDMFSLKLTEGDRATALKEPNSIAISRTLKQKYFGNNSAVGESIEIFDQQFKVVAVFEDFPSHSHFQRNFFFNMESIVAPERLKKWGWSQFHTYIKLKEGTDGTQLESKLKSFAERHAWPETKRNGSYYVPHLMSIQDVHLHASDQLWDVAVRGNIQAVYILSATGIFILVIAILNFVNLSTARAVNRVKEVGVRKVVGALRNQLVQQFVSESVIVALIALVIAATLARLVLPAFNEFTEKSVPLDFLFSPLALSILLLSALAIGVLAGIYPAFYISRHRPTQILSNRGSSGSGKTVLRKSLVVTQFILSFFLIIASLVVSQQYSFMRNTDMGFDKNNLVVVRLRGEMSSKLEVTKHTFANHPNVISATLGYGLPGEAFAGDGIRDKENNNKESGCNLLTVDHDYVKTLGLEIIAGRDFSIDFPSDEKSAFIISESAAKMLGHTRAEDAIGHKLAWPRWDVPDSLKEGQVVGVIKDIQLNSMRDEIRPTVLQIFPFAYSSLTLKIKPDHVPETIAHLEASWKKFNTEWPFEYKFLDENFDQMYKTEEKLATLFTFFTGFAIFVACLGLLGLVVYTTTQKYKEIGIRKVLGANEGALVIQLAKNYVLLISVAFVIAAPFSYLAADQWLSKFAFHIPITAGLFIEAGLLIMLLSLLTVGIQSFNAARANPVDSLKTE